MANKRIAFPISEETWTPEGVVSAYPSMPNRPVASYRIGMRENGDQKYFINEPIFVDVYHRILKKEVKCYVNLYQYPYLVCVKDGRLVPHNMAFFELLSAVDTAMEDILIHNKIRAFTEIRRNLYAKEQMDILDEAREVMVSLITPDDELTHKKFGVGTVVSVNESQIVIRFPEKEMKMGLATTFANGILQSDKDELNSVLPKYKDVLKRYDAIPKRLESAVRLLAPYEEYLE